MTKHRSRAYIYLVIVAIIWGVAAPVIKFTLQGITTLPFLAYRFTISAVLAVVYFLIKGFKFPKGALVTSAFQGLIAYPLALGVLFLGLEKTTVLDVSLITLFGPLLLTLSGALFFRDHITKREKTGITIVFIGAILTTLYPIFNSGGTYRLSGNLLILLFLVSDTGASLMAKKLTKKKVSALALTNLGFIIGALVLVPTAITTYGLTGFINQITTLPLKYHLGVFYMALLSGTLAYYLWILGQKSIEVSEAALFRYLSPLITVPLAVIWLGESITYHFVIGAVMVAIGVYVAEKKAKT